MESFTVPKNRVTTVYVNTRNSEIQTLDADIIFYSVGSQTSEDYSLSRKESSMQSENILTSGEGEIMETQSREPNGDSKLYQVKIEMNLSCSVLIDFPEKFCHKKEPYLF